MKSFPHSQGPRLVSPSYMGSHGRPLSNLFSTQSLSDVKMDYIIFHLKHRPVGRWGRLKSRGNLPGCRQTLERAAHSPGTLSWSSYSQPDTAVRTPSGHTSGKLLNIFVADTDHTGNIVNSSISWELWDWQPPEQPLLVGGLAGHQE